MRLAGHVASMGVIRNTYKILVGKTEGKRPLGKPRRRFEDNIRMNLRETGWKCVNSIRPAQDREQWPGREADHSLPSSADVKNVWSCICTPPIRLHGMVLS